MPTPEGITADHKHLTLLLRSWVGNAPHLDGAIRNMVLAQNPATGADLLHPEVYKAAERMVALLTPIPEVCRYIVRMSRSQILKTGAVIAHSKPTIFDVIQGARPLPWHEYGYFKQGHAAALAFFCWWSEFPEYVALGDRIADFIESRMSTGPHHAGFWCHGDQYATIKDSRGFWVSAWGAASWSWAYVDETYSNEDRNGVANACAVAARRSRRGAYQIATGAMAKSLLVGDGLAPLNMSKRSLIPDWSRDCSVAGYSLDATASFVMFIEQSDFYSDHRKVCDIARDRMAGLRLVVDGREEWPDTIDPATGLQCYPLAIAPGSDRAVPGGRITFDRRLAVRGYDANIVSPAMVFDQKYPPRGGEEWHDC